MTTGSSSPQRRPDGAALVIAAILAGIAIVIFWQTSLMRVPPVQQRVGPTVFPYIVASGLLLLAVGTVFSAFRNGFPERSKDDYGPIFWVVGGLVGQILLLSTAGFSIATGVLFACTAKAFGRGPLWQTIPIGAVFAFVVWFIFAKGLQLSLPMGVLERLLTTGSFV
ncbi:tripartite tricarboxylate transporter TctB family protein [Devosia sp. 63-57]|uniref:tripartite tricarboxylate transporter TctB family protein n=1 Tax=Devosia sp. 63-57 TaxID=1895751 RepID=UPI00086E6F86|nr:tripartite tricarboxylate transporter TctB family protein [Devosia sp. 63-57]ODT47674.1 MAG: C4-dicarboxylate ABC transporter [Pelagibacterium sp. SCN 63-126]ODU88267.1 MAG: C4-dicarboxylate ABC transporter [Pelagibacterium sp. SCN 63-17]OJX42618.1 MAG: C4-dicarboxylate ABC transporter [Devosia sp. 63-57]